ncbi:MAG: glycosyltransferase family 39 protein [Gammaproteobacteria bacterium]|nr:glycosyltransferase family 39 protein [Gammaproteobacteria bacterium]
MQGIRRPSAVVVASFAGSLLILTGVVVPSSALIKALRTTPVELLEQLLLGATFFKIGLVILGLLIIALGRMSIWKSEIQSEKPLPDHRRNFNRALLGALIIAASALRLYGLDSGLWLDEILTYVDHAKMPFGEIVSTYDSENQHLLYSLLTHASFQIFGESAWSLRFPAVLFGIGSIGALYLLGRQVTSAQESLFAAAILAFSYHHVWFSQNGRGYTGLLFWTILASWLLLRGLREKRPQLWLFYAAAAALGVYTHMTMIFVIVGHFIIYLTILFARRREIWPHRWAGFFLGFCLAGFLTLQLYALVLPQLSTGAEKSVVELWKQPLWTLFEFARGLQIGFGGGIVAIFALLIFGAGLTSYARTNPVVIPLLLIPALIGSAVVIGMGHHLWPRFFFFTFGFGALVVVRGAMVLGRGATRLLKLRSFPMGTAACTGLILVSGMSLPSAYGPKQDYGAALAFVKARQKPDDAIVTAGLAAFPYKRFYKVDWKAVETLEALNTIRSSAKRTWLLYTLAPVLQSVYPEIMRSIQRDFKVVKRFNGTLRGGTIFICRSDRPPF